MKKTLIYFIVFLIMIINCNGSESQSKVNSEIQNKNVFIEVSNVNNVDNLKVQIQKTITAISQNNPSDLFKILNDFVDIGIDMTVDKDSLLSEFSLKKGETYSLIFDSSQYFEKYIKTKRIQRATTCEEYDLCIKDNLLIVLKKDYKIQIKNQDNDPNFAVVFILWKPIESCKDNDRFILYYTLDQKDGTWKLSNLNFRRL